MGYSQYEKYLQWLCLIYIFKKLFKIKIKYLVIETLTQVSKAEMMNTLAIQVLF